MGIEHDIREATRDDLRRLGREEAAFAFCKVRGSEFEDGFHFATGYYFTMKGSNILYSVELEDCKNEYSRERQLVVRQCKPLSGGSLGGLVQAVVIEVTRRTKAADRQANDA